MRRREFITLLGGAAVAWPVVGRAQQAGIVPKIGLLWPAASPPAPPRMEAFRQGLQDAGLVEGRDVVIELRFAQGGLQQLAELAAELVRLKVDVIHASGDLAPRAAQRATATIPIVAIADDILGAGLITSLSRPGGTTTGLTILSPELSAKRLEVLRDIIPGLSRVASLWDPTTGTSQVMLTERAAQSLKIRLKVLEVRRRDDLAGAFQAAKAEKADALNVFSSPFLSSLYRQIIDLAAEHRLPAIYQWKEHAEAGGLISYGPSLAGMWRQTAMIVAKVLRGAKPADLPVEQPTKFELVANLKTAKTLGLTIPESFLLRADQVIE
jgi:putative tryptophan/tyrosine transport system substrate-binding protein